MGDQEETTDAPETSPEDLAVDLTPIIARKFIWDLVGHADVEKFFEEFGIVRGDDEGLELEHLDSHLRLAHMAPLEQLVSSLNSVGIDVFSSAWFRQYTDNAVSDEDKARFKDLAFVMTRIMFFALLGQLIDLKVVKIGNLNRTLQASDFMGE